MTTARKIPKPPVSVRKPAAKKAVARKSATKPPHKPAKAAASVRRAPDTAAAQKPDKPKKPKLVRDSFTIPKIEFTVLQDLKQRAAISGTAAKKSEILRAGIKALAAMNDAAFRAALAAVPAIKTGRPAKE